MRSHSIEVLPFTPQEFITSREDRMAVAEHPGLTDLPALRGDMYYIMQARRARAHDPHAPVPRETTDNEMRT